MTEIKALSLFSGGLDSILATRVVMAQGINVIGIKFVSPFFHYEILNDVDAYIRSMREKYGVDVLVVDISEEYLEMLRQPAYGFGKNFNPCVDCKIFMVRKAKEMLSKLGASFLISGEVLGQRPMSQRRDTLNIISRDSDSRSFLLRPLSAKLMTPTEPELEGLVDREQLLNFSGRGRSRQIALAKEFGISDYPAPAGGCTLADPILSRRIKKFYADDFVVKAEDMTVKDILLLLVGRQFQLPGGGWLILGRDMHDNKKLSTWKEEGDALFHMEKRPGPTALLRRAGSGYGSEEERDRDLHYAAQLVVRYGKKIEGGRPAAEVSVRLAGHNRVITAETIGDENYMKWML